MTQRLYSLEARDATGVFLGLSAVELTLVGGGFMLAIAGRLAGLPAAACALPLLAGFGLAKARVGGRPVREWVPLLAGWVSSRASGRRSWAALLPLFPSGTAALPAVLRGLELCEVPAGPGPGPGTVAAVADPRAARLTAVLAVEGAQFACQDPAAQDSLLAGWGDVLSAHAEAGGVVQVGWSDAATLSGLAVHADWATDQLAGVDGTVGDPASYHGLLAELAGIATTHETVVWVTVDGTRAREGRGRPIDRARRALPAVVDNLTATLATAGLRTDGPLTSTGLARLLRARVDPADEACRANRPGRSLAERLGLVDTTNAGPIAVAAGWSEVRLDGSFHRTYWVESWPRRPVPGDWLQGFLAAGESRTMTVLHRPLSPERSTRRIESQMVKLTAHRARKEDKDRRVTANDLRTEQAVADLEDELAAGYAEVLYLGLVTVSSPTLDGLDDAGRRIEQAARARGLGLRLLHGRQDVAWAATLPFGLADPGLLQVAGI